MGGDHMISYPILRAVASKHGPVALIHVDAHSDTAEHQASYQQVNNSYQQVNNSYQQVNNSLVVF